MPIHRDLYERERTLVDATGKVIDNSNPLAVTVAGGGGPATIADGADQAEGAKADTAATTDTGTFSLIALFKRLLQKFTTQLPAALTGSGNLKVSLQESNASQAVTLATLPALTAGSALIGKVDVNKVPGTISTNNSTTTPLTSGSVFTGPADDVSGFAAIAVNVIADQAGTLAPQFSSNGTNWDFVGSHAIAANVGQMFVFRPGTQFFRLVYTNGGTNQGAFRLQTILHLDDIDIATVQALGAGLPNPTTEQVGADLMVQTGGGTTWAPAKADSSNRLTFSSDDGSLASLGATADTAATTDTGTFSLIALFKRLLQKFTTQFPAALTGSGNLKAAIVETTVTQPVSGTVTANAGTGTLATSTADGASTSIGATTDTAATTDTGTFSLIALFKRLLQKFTTQLPSALISNRLDVNLGAAPATVTANATLQAATVAAGNVGGLTKTISSVLTRPANTTTYTANDEMTDTGGTIRTLTGAGTVSGGKGIITHCLLSCSSNGATKPTYTVYVYDTTSTPQTDNAAFAPSDGVQDTCIGSFTLTSAEVGDATAGTGNFTMDSGQIHIPYTTVGGADLFFRVKVTNGYTPGANSDTNTFRFKVQQDAN